ncbi:uracil-DNA glycosylase [Aeromicrobium sp. REDSEA-S38_B2]|uniref:uracil-DNA glycosylase n=1 Tax=Aeromicrobium sp. REDSEA-S38_B2 TaxID=1811528 RepID=UPI000AFF165E|nr:uracil-DNA glycosylase [Aeromicrobium sp. REDSEA-S38_B2]
MPHPLRDVVGPGWADALAPVEDEIHRLGDVLRRETAEGRPWLPAGDAILRAFREPFADVKVLVVGQDPYPTPGHPIGLSFAVERDVWPLPRSLVNIYVELRDDLGIVPPRHGDLSGWADSGVMLLNRALTVAPGSPASHRGKGWEPITSAAIDALVRRHAAGHPLVAVLWGRDAQSLRPALGDVPCLESAHPSPLSARRGFFGSHPFSRANAFLEESGRGAVDWRV